MDQKSSRLTKEKLDYKPTYQKQTRQYEMYDETVTHQRNVEKKKLYCKRGHPVDKDLPSEEIFQIPESDRNRYVTPYPGYDYGRPLNDSEKHPVSQLVDPSNTNCFQNKPSTCRGPDSSKSQQVKSFEKETKQVNYETSLPTVNYQDPNHTVLPGYQEELEKHSSLICKAINYDGEPVTVNDQVIRNKLILSCRPRRYYGTESFSNKPLPIDPDHPLSYRYPPPHPSGYEDVKIQRTTDIEYQQKISGHSYPEARPYTEKRTCTGTGKPVLSRMDAYGLGLGENGEKRTKEQINESEKEGEKYEEQYRAMQCKSYTRNFKLLLWALLIISTLLVLIGLALLTLTLTHFLFHDYINIVIAQEGYVHWLWGALVLSLCITIVGVYGIITAITRAKRMLVTYCITASVLALVIVIYMLIFWLMNSNLRATEKASMVHTFNQYRCLRWVRQAWDTVHEKYQCCGVEARGDWKYIPPSCCHAETKFQRLACINHFIQEDQAYKGGCRTKMEDYFTSMFLLISCLLLLAVILLLLGILAALRLLKIYKIILLCREMYFIMPP